MVVLKALALLFWLVIIPFLMGLSVQWILPITKKTAGITFIIGYLLSFCVFEVIGIPCMIKIQYSAFKYCTRIFVCAELLIALIGAINLVQKLRYASRSGQFTIGVDNSVWNKVKTGFFLIFPGDEKSEAEALMNPRTDVRAIRLQCSKEGLFFWGVFFVILGFQLVMALVKAPFDGDDAYYVVESLLAQQADVMNTIIPDTGVSTPLPMRHAMAVFTMWQAFIAKVSFVHSTIVAHSVMPLVLIPLVYLVYAEIGRILFSRKPDSLPIFMIFVSLFTMFGNTSIYTAETFFMMRTWQGKAMAANLMLPLILWAFIWMFDDCRKPGYLWKEETGGGKVFVRNSAWIILMMVNMASGIMSSMGTVFCGGLSGFLAFLILIYTRNLKIVIKIILAMIPSALYIMCYMLIKMQ
ncbi:MAG: hypothetical protein K6G06_08360 [Butyrivibrio sp.]|nr:hypothetical protein [Butyrivibrio sp.]